MATLLPLKGGGNENDRLVFYAKNGGHNGHHHPPRFYGSAPVDEAERELLLGKPNLVPEPVEFKLAFVIGALFLHEHHYSHAHPRTNPPLPPEKRGKRHRDFYVYQLNQFRHWWKTSRLLVRLAGSFIYITDGFNWIAMTAWDLSQRKEIKLASKQMKRIGQGGPIKPFLEDVHPFTRSIRIVLAVARAWEARVDNRLYEVGIAEAL